MWLTNWLSEEVVCVRMDTTGKRFRRINNKTRNKNKTAHKKLSMHDDTALSLPDIGHMNSGLETISV